MELPLTLSRLAGRLYGRKDRERLSRRRER